MMDLIPTLRNQFAHFEVWAPNSWERVMADQTDFDIVIVGGGAVGSVAACLMAQIVNNSDKQLKIAVVERNCPRHLIPVRWIRAWRQSPKKPINF